MTNSPKDESRKGQRPKRIPKWKVQEDFCQRMAREVPLQPSEPKASALPPSWPTGPGFTEEKLLERTFFLAAGIFVSLFVAVPLLGGVFATCFYFIAVPLVWHRLVGRYYSPQALPVVGFWVLYGATVLGVALFAV